MNLTKRLTGSDGARYEVSVWDERDRLHLSVTNEDTGAELLDAWDDDARALIEDGFIQTARQPEAFARNILNYALNR